MNKNWVIISLNLWWARVFWKLISNFLFCFHFMNTYVFLASFADKKKCFINFIPLKHTFHESLID